MSALTRFLGDTPLRVLVKLVVISLIVGFIMSVFHWTPWDLLSGVRDMVLHLWHTGFAAVSDFINYILIGAVIVVPIFVISRILSYRR
ncbi:DUF6460 domain-containing protein [Chelativorans sp. YIM 93263]|uniref:DUF6460 domain-containing protein n=1 Tax=Chelativorans sp. YIM 93263 TaxID=2906648 RepID=UPI00237884AB|nr:DUF6460 domain-containing protein [Chelativorans sp. YIM 93263]